MDTSIVTQQEHAQTNAFVAKVFLWMFFALLTTGLVSLYVVSSRTILRALFSSNFVFYGLLIGEFILVSYLSRSIGKITSSTATFLFFAYSALNGVTLSVVFLLFTAESIASTFFIAASTFGVMSFYGMTTKRDLTSLGSLCFMGLIGVVIASVINLFFFNEMIYWVTTFIGIFVFVGLTAYDTQKIKIMGRAGLDQTTTEKATIMGALALYLDFINLFLLLLRIFGKRR